MRTALPFSIAAALMLAACEDGPQQVFTPNTGDPAVQNGYTPADPWVQDGSKGYDDQSGGDSVGRARFCDEDEAARQIEAMVVAPIIPDQSIGTVPLWSSDGQPLHADDLLGRPEDGKLCDPTEPYANAFVYGPTQEVIVFFNQDTRLVEGVMAYTSYLGALEGTYTSGGRKVPVVIKPRERLQIDGVEMDQYTARADQASKPRAWLNYKNVSAVYAMLRETFFNAPPFPDDFNCITEKLCDVVYTGSNETNPQDAFIVVQDTGVQMRFTPDGYITFVYAEPVRAAPFEGSGNLDFGAAGTNQMAMKFDSTSRTNCSLSLDDALTFSTFKQRCIDQGDTKTLARASYQVSDARDSVDVGFNGITLSFLRDTRDTGATQKPVFHDGEAPADDDVLFGIGFTRSLPAIVDEFRPRTLGNLYKAKLEARLLAAISGPNPELHPLALYSVPVPFVFDSPQAIDVLETPVGKQNWVQAVLDQVTALYYSLTPEEQAAVDPQVIEPLFLVEPFVDSVLEAFTHGESNGADAFKVFRTTDDRRWSIGYAHFQRGGVPYRIQAQYNLDYGALTAVFVERGESAIDEIFSGLNGQLHRNGEPYYSIELARSTANFYGLGGTGIAVTGFDRQLATLAITATVSAPGGFATVDLVVPGDPIQDRNGYLKQINGERYEFVAADVVKLYGHETSMVYYVEADGAIGRVEQNRFKGALELCPGLSLSYGDDVRRTVSGWADAVSRDTYTACNVVYNYSTNGNVLDSVTSIANRVSFTVVNGRAVSAAVWR